MDRAISVTGQARKSSFYKTCFNPLSRVGYNFLKVEVYAPLGVGASVATAIYQLKSAIVQISCGGTEMLSR